MKRQRTDETSCKAVAVNFKDAPAFDVIIKEEFLEQVCDCEMCTKMLAKIKDMKRAIEERDEDATKLDNNLNGDVNPNPEKER